MRNCIFVFLLFIVACSKPFVATHDVAKLAPQLPKQELPHPKNSLEWWYLTGFLTDEHGRTYGVEYVFFHFYTLDKISRVMVNVALSVPEDSSFYYDYTIKPTKNYLPQQFPLNFSLNNYHWEGKEGNYTVQAQMKKHPVGFKLTTQSTQAPILHGDSGYVYYGDIADAGYYSYSRLNTQGELYLKGDTLKVTGLFWYDRQWNCGAVSPMKVSWDWMSIHLNNGSDLMIYRVKDPKKNKTIYGGTYRDSVSTYALSDTSIYLSTNKYWKSPKSKKSYPLSWNIELSDIDAKLNLQAMFPNQELTVGQGFQRISYWEGMCTVTGTIKQKNVSGNAYLEMTNK